MPWRTSWWWERVVWLLSHRRIWDMDWLQAPRCGGQLWDQATWQTCGWDVQLTTPKRIARSSPKLLASGFASGKLQSMFYWAPWKLTPSPTTTHPGPKALLKDIEVRILMTPINPVGTAEFCTVILHGQLWLSSVWGHSDKEESRCCLPVFNTPHLWSYHKCFRLAS